MNSGFHAFCAQHMVVLAAIAILCFVLAWQARCASPSARAWVGRSLGFVLLGYAAVLYLKQAAEHALAWQYSLPLDLCDFVLIACIISLFWPNRWTAEIAYFWGLGGALQATLTPDLSRGFPSWDFIFFFWGHGAALAGIVFLVAAGYFRPCKNSILRMMIAVNCYALAVGAIDAIANWNYGYLCRKPAGASLFDFLGPWPWYVLSLEAVALLLFYLLYLPWRIRRAVSL